jgi:Ran GTPase-activating protein (RanGAP) involved in mRNA processing and transport
MRKERIKYRKGLREVILKRNKLGDYFAEQLSGCIRYDKYLKVLDISTNAIESGAMKGLIRMALAEN